MLGAPQVNLHGGRLPEANGHRYPKMPLDRFEAPGVEPQPEDGDPSRPATDRAAMFPLP